jgi:hypothetical protein
VHEDPRPTQGNYTIALEVEVEARLDSGPAVMKRAVLLLVCGRLVTVGFEGARERTHGGGRTSERVQEDEMHRLG